jgi:hypothetical protein
MNFKSILFFIAFLCSLQGIAVTKTSAGSNLWSLVAWTPAGAPAPGDDIIIRAGDVVTFNIGGAGYTCNSLTVNGTLKIGILTATKLIVSNNITVIASGKLLANSAATHTLFVGGNILNNGQIDLSPTATKICNITFAKNGNATLSGTGILNRYNLITLNMGASSANTLSVTTTKFATRAATTSFLTLINGTFQFSSPVAAAFQLFNGNTTIATTCGIILNNATTTFNTVGGSLTLAGNITLSTGIFNVGNAADNDLISSNGKLTIAAGTMNLAGKYYELNGANNAIFTMSGGTFTLPTIAPAVTAIAPFQLNNAGSQFNISNGTIIIKQNGGGANLGFINNNTGGAVTGGILQIGNGSLAANQTITINSNRTIPGLTVNDARVTANLATSIAVLNSVIITTGTLSTNNFNISLGGNWSDAAAGIYTGGTSTVTFNGALAESITKTGGTETFYALSFTGAGLKTLGSAVIVNNNLSIAAGASLDVSVGNFAMTINGNWSDAGSFVCRTGTVTFNSATAQSIMDATGETFNVLALTNTGVKTLGGPVSTNSNMTIGVGSSLDVSASNYSLTVNGNWTDNGSFTCRAGTVTLSGAAAQSLTKASLETFYKLTLNGASTKTLATSILVNSDLTIGAGATFDIGAALNPITVNGNWLDNGTFTSRTGTVTFNGATAQTITRAAGETFNILVLSGAGVKTLGGPVTTKSNLTISSGSALDASASGYALNVGGNWSDLGTFAASTGTVTLNLAGAQSISDPAAGGEIFNNLSLIAGNTKTLACPVTLSGNLVIAAATTFDVSPSNYLLTVNGNWTNSGTFNPRAGTVVFGGTAQTIARTVVPGETLNIVSISGSGTKTLGSALTVNSNLTIAAGCTLDVSAGNNYGLAVKGNWTNNGTFVAQAGIVQLTGAALQNIGGASMTTFNSITLNNAAGATLTAGANLGGTLTLTKGNFTTTGQTFTLLSTATGTANIATIPAAGNFTGNITMQRYVAPGKTGWYFLGAPIAPPTALTLSNWNSSFYMTGFTGSNKPTYGFVSVYTYKENVTGILDSGYVPATNVTNPVTFGKGYWCYIGPVPLTISVSGAPGKGNFTFPVTYTPTAPAASNLANDGWNLISNPYPSSIDWSIVGAGTWTKTNMAGAVYIWNPTTSSYSSWVGGVGTNGGSSIMTSSQAFWVQANGGGAPTLSITEKCKTNTNTGFYRASQSITENTLRLRLSGNNYSDETVIHLADSATSHYDPEYDAYKLKSMDPAAPNISSISDSTDLSINSMASLGAGISIPLRITVGSGHSGTYTITRDSVLTFSLSSCLLLEDKLTGITTDLRSTPAYSFVIQDTTQTPRFFLHVGAPIAKRTVASFCPGSSDGLAIAQGFGSSCTYTWSDQQNHVLQVHNLVAGADTLRGLTSGTYQVLIGGNAGNCSSLNDTFQVSSPLAISSFSSVTNVSCNQASDGAITVNSVMGGTFPYNYSWSGGSMGPALNGLPQGTYTLQVTDAHHCPQLFTYPVGSNSVLHAFFSLSADTLYSGAELQCLNNSTGSGSYVWNFGDQSAADSSANPFHQFIVPGVFKVTLKTYDGICTDSVSRSVLVMSSGPTGVHKTGQVSNDVNIVSSGGDYFVAFNLSQEGTALISIFNSEGKRILTEMAVSAYQNRIALPLDHHLASGIYLVSVNINGKITSRKILL